MKNYDANTAIVLDTLTRYRYSISDKETHEKLYESLRPVLEVGVNPVFSPKVAKAWCDSLPVRLKNDALLAVNRLDDVYQHGRILGTHLKFQLLPTDYYASLVADYVSSLKENCNESTVCVIQHHCLHFCCFAQYNGIQNLENISYSLLEKYDVFLKDSYVESKYHVREGRIASFLMYWAKKGYCRIGHSLYMSYAKTDRIITMADLSEQARQVVEERREESHYFPPDEFYAIIPDFVQQIKDAGYSRMVSSRALCFMHCFYLFIDIENLGYDRVLVAAWVNDVAPSFFGAVSGLRVSRRIFEMFEDYVNEGKLMPGHYWRHALSGFDILPLWYKDQLVRFLEDKQKEGRSKNTLDAYKDSGVRLYRFLEAKGIDSFDKITPEVIKKFAIEDTHSSITGKQIIFSRLKMFLTHLEIGHVVREGLHYAIPTCSSDGEKKIVQVCTEEDRQNLQNFCENPSTPRQIRDAAILRIGMNTGMRPSDVMGLRWGDVDFQKGCVRFTQSKTGVPLVVSLDVDTRNALFVYFRDVRPRNLPHDYLFVSLRTPHNRLSSEGGGHAMRYAGIEKGGYRMLRRTHATDMVGEGATIEEAAEKLGHSNTDTIHKYVVLDENRMRLCPLSMEETGLVLDRRRYVDG